MEFWVLETFSQIHQEEDQMETGYGVGAQIYKGMLQSLHTMSQEDKDWHARMPTPTLQKQEKTSDGCAFTSEYVGEHFAWWFSLQCWATYIPYWSDWVQVIVCSWFQIPTNIRPGRPQVIVQVLEFLLPTWKTWSSWLQDLAWHSPRHCRHLGSELENGSSLSAWLPFSISQLNNTKILEECLCSMDSASGSMGQSLRYFLHF